MIYFVTYRERESERIGGRGGAQSGDYGEVAEHHRISLLCGWERRSESCSSCVGYMIFVRQDRYGTCMDEIVLERILHASK
jgi:hypothetical protein